MDAEAAAAIAETLSRIPRPKRAVVTAGMPYANGPLHIGHLAGAHVPADIYARWLGMVIGRSNVLFVCGTDEHGSTSELAAMRAGRPIREFIDEVHDQQATTLARYDIGLDTYSGTSRPDCFPLQTQRVLEFLRKLQAHGLLEKRRTQQWFDPKIKRFLADRFVRGRCPNPSCDNEDASGDECDVCGQHHDPSELINPRSAVSDATPELRDTEHLFLDIWSVAEVLRGWVAGKKKTWRNSVVTQVLDQLQPSLLLQADQEEPYKKLKASLPAHRQRYARGKQVVLQFGQRSDFDAAQGQLRAAGIESKPITEWAHRSITRDTEWGIPLGDFDPALAGKTLYVWPDSLIAPITFSQLALASKGQDMQRHREFWNDPDARVVQFLGQDNVFFYVIMQGALWLGTQADPQRMPQPGELQLTDVFGCFHLMVSGEKMSKSKGNFLMGDDLLDKGYSADQIRYYLSLLGLPDKPSDFDFKKLDERNAFLGRTLNAVFERPISAAHSKFGGKVPAGKLDAKVATETARIVKRYATAMQRGDYPGLLFEVERYARIVNSLFTQYKPHDDRRPEPERADALYSAFFVLKNLIILLYPFVPSTMDRVRQSLKLPEDVFSVDQLGTGMDAGHEVGAKQEYFPPVAGGEE